MIVVYLILIFMCSCSYIQSLGDTDIEDCHELLDRNSKNDSCYLWNSFFNCVSFFNKKKTFEMCYNDCDDLNICSRALDLSDEIYYSRGSVKISIIISEILTILMLSCVVLVSIKIAKIESSISNIYYHKNHIE